MEPTMKSEFFTHESVDAIEDDLRKAQNLIESAARKLCSSHHPVATSAWNDLCRLSRAIAEVINHLYQLRPLD